MNADSRIPGALRGHLEGARGRALLLTRNNLSLAQALAEANPALSWQVLTKDDVRGLSPRKILDRLRAEPWAVLVVEDEAREIRRRHDLYRALLTAARGRTRWLVVSEGDGATALRVHPAAALPSLAGAGVAEALASARAVAWAWGLERRLQGARKNPPPRATSAPPRVAALRTDFWFGLKAGGSVSHALGVLGAMRSLGLATKLWTSSRLPDPQGRLDQREVPPARRPSWIEEAAIAAYNRTFVETTEPEVRAFRPDVLYQRHSLLSLAGLDLARKMGVPLVLEVNASEVWARQAWSRLHLEKLAVAMERTAFAGADRLVLVSEELVPTVLQLGARHEQLVVNPNGVDLARFPEADRGDGQRATLGIPKDAVVCGFLGTFTRWHGVLFLAEQIPALLDARSDLWFLLLGDGDLRPQVAERLAGRDRVRFTGLLPPEAVPGHLAACDLLLSPHLPFEDGTVFFGSPTKLFEYLATGRPVVASRLGQIGRVVEDGKTGILYPPGDGAAFRAAVARLAADPAERTRMGREARATVAARYTWEANVRRALEGLVPLPAPGPRETGSRKP